MELKAHAISVQGPHAPMLHATSIRVSDHQLVLLAGYPGPGHVALALGLSGRLKPNGGDVQLDGDTSGRLLRQRVAVVDTPGITEPDDALPVRTIVGEELAIAGRKAGRKAVDAWLTEHDWAAFAERRFEHLPVGVRTEMLAELTVARPEVKFVILTMPDRLGGDPHDWYAVGRELASRGYGVVITCADASARLLGVEAAQLGSVNQPDPVQVEAVAAVEVAAPVEAVAPVEPVAAEVATQPVVPVEDEVPEVEEAAEEEIDEPEVEAADDEEPVVDEKKDEA
ncbi:hypothetical protein OHA70_12400 [Kribbella sp. NBC_00382]|uniref:hypothetical protein n=1 Tax=Kribbella sp. NBC_00382 TaxID=2975967 RepID=UPI002E219ACC